MAKKLAVIDGANIAYEEKSKDGAPKVSNILAVRTALEEKGYEPLVIVDASLIYKIDDPQQFEALIEDQAVRQVPAETDGDYFVIETTENGDAVIVSNDEYEPYQRDHRGLAERRVPVMIVNGKAELYEPRLEQSRGQD
jgi:hypothetical protein